MGNTYTLCLSYDYQIAKSDTKRELGLNIGLIVERQAKIENDFETNNKVQFNSYPIKLLESE